MPKYIHKYTLFFLVPTPEPEISLRAMPEPLLEIPEPKPEMPDAEAVRAWWQWK